MKVVNTENIYRIYADALRTYDSLPAQTYTVCFGPKTGFFLELAPNIKIKEKIYGNHETKALKILDTFKIYTRNLGVILSGDKGIGKSICAKLLAQHSVERGYPVLLVNEYVPGIADFLSSIDQEVVVVFDEFDKTFDTNKRNRDGEPSGDSQVEMLTLFDGMNQGKKLFIVTCNELRGLNEYLVNRPGRFHYHLRFEYPNPEEIEEYLKDNIPESSYSEIAKVIDFSSKVNINYDCLRSIAFELSLGSSFEESVKDLNIVNVEREVYKASVIFTDGTKASERDLDIDFFGEDEYQAYFRINGDVGVYITFDLSKTALSTTSGIIMTSENISEMTWDFDDVSEEEQEKYEALKVEKAIFKRRRGKDIHYAF